MLLDLYKKYKETILYLIFGGLTTLVNIATYGIMYNMLGIDNVPSNVVAWILSVVFAYITNKLFVFESKSFSPKVLLGEMSSFFLCRLATGALDLLIMYYCIDVCGLDKFNLIIKIASNVLVIILNYVASKIFIFKKKDDHQMLYDILHLVVVFY